MKSFLRALCLVPMSCYAVFAQETVPESKEVTFGRVQISRDNKQIVGISTSGFKVLLFDRAKGKPKLLTPRGYGPIWDCGFSADGKNILIGGDRYWTFQKNPELEEWFVRKGTLDPVELFWAGSFAVPNHYYLPPAKFPELAPDHHVAIDYGESKEDRKTGKSTYNRKLLLVNLNGVPRYEIASHKTDFPFPVYCMAFSNDATYLAYHNPEEENRLCLFKRTELKVVNTIPLKDRVWKMAFSLDNKKLFTVTGEKVEIFDLSDDKLKHEKTLDLTSVFGLHVNPKDGSILIAKRGPKREDFYVLDPKTYKTISRFDVGMSLTCHELSPDGTLLLGGVEKGGIHIWPLSKFK